MANRCVMGKPPHMIKLFRMGKGFNITPFIFNMMLPKDNLLKNPIVWFTFAFSFYSSEK